MNQSSMTVRKGGSSTVRRKLDTEDEIIRIPDCDLDLVAERFRLTLIGRVFHLRGRSIDALIHLLPRNRIWNVEGRVRGINLGNGRFQFDFDNESDLLSVLNKRPCHFNQWSFALERWEPFTCESFPNTIPFWISVTGVPVHFWNNKTFIEISKALGTGISLDSARARIQASVNVDKPLQFERRIQFPNGDTGRVSFSYDGLHRYCFTCRMISHDENACPNLTQEERDLKRKQRAEINAQGDNPRSSLACPPSSARPETLQRSRSPSYGRHPPLTGRHRNSPPKQIQDDYRREEKRQKHSSSRDYGGYQPTQKERSFAWEFSHKNHTHKENVWRRLELPPRTSSAYGKNPNSRTSRNENSFPHRERTTKITVPPRDRHSNHRHQDSRVWRPRLPPRDPPTTDTTPVSSRAPHRVFDTHTLAVSDSQRTISDHPGNLEPGEIIRGDHLKSPTSETAEERLRRIKGKSLITDTPTSRDREPLSILRRQRPPPPDQTNMVSGNFDMDLDLEFDQELDITLTEDELAMVDNLVKETELLEMDEAMLDNDDLLDESPDVNAEKIDAISQLSPAPANAETTIGIQKDFMPPPAPLPPPPPAPRAPAPTQTSSKKAAQPQTQRIAKGYLKKHTAKSPDLKGAKASKKLNQIRGRCSPRKRTTPGNTTFASSIAVPRNEVFPSAISKNSVSLSGSVVSQKPPSKKI
ncbi:hypothetical protein N665_1754s0001 [Sinapis alba]|nr:hypothetical protein N665_1754s0001 [Sinapis alba]